MIPGGRSRRSACRGRLVAVLLAAAVLSGCEQKEDRTRPALSAPPRDARIALDTPAAAARSLFTLVKDHLDAVAASDRVAAARWRDQIAWYVADRDAITRRVRAALGERMPPAAVAVAEYVENWAAMLNYYVDALDLENVATAVEDREARLLVHLRHEQRDAALALACVQDVAGEWRVSEVQFVPPPRQPAATVPATQPAAP